MSEALCCPRSGRAAATAGPTRPFLQPIVSVQPVDYRQWQIHRVSVLHRALAVATKPGVFGHGHDDPAATMLADAVRSASQQRVVSMACGNGVVGAAAALSGAAAVWMTDRHVLACDASTRTLEANAIGPMAQVRLGHGAAPLSHDIEADIVTVRVVPESFAMHQLLRDALHVLRPGGRVLLAGGNHEGAKSAGKLLSAYCGYIRLDAQHSAHRLVSAVRPDVIPEVAATEAQYFDREIFHDVVVPDGDQRLTIYTRPGVFSWQHLDEGSAELLACLEVNAGDRVLDLGCGAGVLGAICALRQPTATVTLVDEDCESVRCAQRTLDAAGLANARALTSDIASAVLDSTFDLVVTNPPFHVGKHTSLELPRQFIRDARAVLAPKGRLLLVANRTLPYESLLREQFDVVRMRSDGRRFKVLQAEVR